MPAATLTLTLDALPGGRVFVASTCAAVTVVIASIKAFRLLNCARNGADSISAFVGG